LNVEVAGGAGEGEEGFEDVGAAEGAGVEEPEFGGAEEVVAFGWVLGGWGGGFFECPGREG
jgi:hypothetical protein